MLTSFQASPIAYWADDYFENDDYWSPGDGPFCSNCADHLARGETESGEHDELMIHYYNTPRGFQPASRYGVEEAYAKYGVECVRCGETIVEPDPDLCQYHDDVRYDADASFCYTGETDDERDECYFAGEHDPNPPVPRWVPCDKCGARDGEPHREGCERIG